jgi:WD repeat-containing protein 35
MFLGDASMRNKFNLILCEAMTPMLPADDYMDKGEYENELKQVSTTTVNHSNIMI